MKTKRFFTTLLLAAVTAFATSTYAKDDQLVAAIQKLQQSGSYTWRTEVTLTTGLPTPAIIEGKYHSAQGLHVKVVAGKNTIELAARGKVVIAKVADEWRLAKKFTRSDTAHSMARELGLLSPPHVDMAAVQDTWRTDRKNTDNFFAGKVNLSTARKLMTSSIKQVGALVGNSLTCSTSNAVITIADGLPAKVVIEITLSSPQGLLSANSSAKLTSITTFSDVGKTTLVLSPEAEAALQAAQKP